MNMHNNVGSFKRFVALALSLLMVLQMMPVASLSDTPEGYSSVSSDSYEGLEYAKVAFLVPGEEEGEYISAGSWDVEIAPHGVVLLKVSKIFEKTQK